MHVSMMFVAFALTIGGFYAIYANKNRAGKSHFATWHGKLGLVTFIIACVQVVLLGAPAYFGSIRPGWVKSLQLRQLHKSLAVFFAIFSPATLVLGFKSKWFSKAIDGAFPDISSAENLRMFLLVVFSLIAIFSYGLLLRQLYDRNPQAQVFQLPMRLFGYRTLGDADDKSTTNYQRVRSESPTESHQSTLP